MSGIRIGGPNKGKPFPGDAPKGGKLNRSLSSGQSCTYLSSIDKGVPYNHASSQNVCKGQTSKQRQGLRMRTLGYAKILRKTQTEVCLANYHECEHFKRQRKNETIGHLPSENLIQEIDSKSKTPYKPPQKHDRRHRKTSFDMESGNWRTAKQLGAISAVTIAIAFVASFFISGGPGKIIENLTFMFIQNQAQELGLNKDDLEKVRASGILKGGSVKGLKKLSRSQKAKLKKSSLFRGMSSAKKAELRKKFGKR
ncbi:MAG: hypothetical protein HOC91_05865 [Nitrospinaceae bacterium]|nr:hypothetical protein [Nitrospinaceae bacterium]MBT6395362.1 hypothetical protein [Nitrospinaceae bacterium]